MRRTPRDKDGSDVQAPSVILQPDESVITQKREYELITPLFGGGVEPGEADPVTVVRGTEVRGQLRFWWRATRGGRPEFNGELERMKDTEDKLWGAASTERKPRPANVTLHVQVSENHRGQKFEVRDRFGKEIDVHAMNSDYGYAAFPLRDKKKGARVLEKVMFSLSISYPRAEEAEVQAALWAWETFGGIGARTRRGFGSLRLSSIDGVSCSSRDAKQVFDLIKSETARHLASGKWPPDVPCLPLPGEQIAFTSPERLVIVSWKNLIASLKNFRQDRPIKESVDPNTGRKQKKLGRSRWPEPDEIRRLTERCAPQHSTPLSTVRRFPRADFGLPIIFQFHPDDVPKGDPKPTTLEGRNEKQTRLASPLILKPIACANNQAVGMAVILDAPRVPPGGLVLRGALDEPSVSSNLDDLSDAELDSIAPLDGQEDVLQAFLNYLTK